MLAVQRLEFGSGKDELLGSLFRGFKNDDTCLYTGTECKRVIYLLIGERKFAFY